MTVYKDPLRRVSLRLATRYSSTQPTLRFLRSRFRPHIYTGGPSLAFLELGSQIALAGIGPFHLCDRVVTRSVVSHLRWQEYLVDVLEGDIRGFSCAKVS